MKHNYEKPTIDISHWIVKPEDIERLYKFFQQRFSKSDIRITLETESGHNREYENLEEYLEDLPTILAESEVISKIKLSESDRSIRNMLSIYKHIWVNINFGKYCNASMHLSAGDTDGSYKDWVEGTYSELKKLKAIFEISDERTIKILSKNYNKIVFDPTKEIEKKIAESLKSKQNITKDKINVVVEKNNEGLGQFTLKQFIIFLFSIIGLLIVAWLTWKFGWM